MEQIELKLIARLTVVLRFADLQLGKGVLIKIFCLTNIK